MNVADLFHPPGLVSGSTAPPRKRRLRILIACGALLFVAGTVLTLTWSRLRPSQTDAGLSAEMARAEARRSLAAFLSASTVEQRAEWVMNGPEVLPFMQAYYAGRELDPLSADDFQAASWNFNVEAPDRIALELPRGRALPTVVACMKKANSGRWLIDWDIWTQSSDGRFRDFITRPFEGEHTLRVRLTSSSGSPEGVKLEVADPFNVGSSLTFDITRPDLTALYLADLPSGSSRTATVQLVWLNDGLTGTLQPVLRRHVCWGFQDLDGVEALEREPARARKHHPPMPEAAKGELAVSPVIEAAVETTVIGNSTGAAPVSKVKITPSRRTTRK